MVMGENFGELVALRIWWEKPGKLLANCNKLSLSSLIKTCHSHGMLNLKLHLFYFIITCGNRMVCAFAASSVVRG